MYYARKNRSYVNNVVTMLLLALFIILACSIYDSETMYIDFSRNLSNESHTKTNVKLTTTTNFSEKANEQLIIPDIKDSLQMQKELEAQQRIRFKLGIVDNVLQELMLVYSAEKESQVTNLLDEVKLILEAHPGKFSDIRNEYVASLENFMSYRQMISSINTKISNVQISEHVDMSKVIGFTTEEMKYFLKNARNRKGELIIPNGQLVEELAVSITTTIKEYPVNEIFALSVMSLESGYFTSDYMKNHNNVGGVLRSDRTSREYATISEGISAAIKCIDFNMKGNNTAYEINSTYCEPSNGNKYAWADVVLDVMEIYTSSFLRLENDA